MAQIQLTNFGDSQLASGITAGSTSISVTTGHGTRFPTLAAGDWFYAVLVDTSGNREIVKATAKASDTFTVTRAQEGTSALAFAVGSVFSLRLTVQALADRLAGFAPLAGPSFSGTLTHSGDIVLSGTAKRITGDFSNATVANRVLFQTSTVDGASNIGIIPNGTSTTSALSVYNNSDQTNASQLQIAALSTDARINSAITGAGTYTPMTFYTGGSERMRIGTSGNVTVTNAGGGLGYGTGAGGTVTQATSRTTDVTLNKPTGAITLFTAAGSATAATFTVTNSIVAATDTIVLSVKSGTNVYLTAVTAVAAGSFNITFWTTGGTASDAPVINFAVIKGATA